MKRGFRWIAVALGFVHTAAYGLDHKNIDENRPLRLEDPYSIAQGEIALEGGVEYRNERQTSGRAALPIQILFGALLNTQFELGTTLLTNPRAVTEESRSGDLEIGGLYNFNQESLHLPALGLKLSTNLPTGIDSSGAELEIKGLVTKSIARLSLYLNASHVFVSQSGGRAGDDIHEFLFGAAYPIGAPRYTRLMLIADLFTELSSDLVGAELGLRHQFTRKVVLDAGAGAEFSGPADRTSFQVRVGASIGM